MNYLVMVSFRFYLNLFSFMNDYIFLYTVSPCRIYWIPSLYLQEVARYYSGRRIYQNDDDDILKY